MQKMNWKWRGHVNHVPDPRSVQIPFTHSPKVHSNKVVISSSSIEYRWKAMPVCTIAVPHDETDWYKNEIIIKLNEETKDNIQLNDSTNALSIFVVIYIFANVNFLFYNYKLNYHWEYWKLKSYREMSVWCISESNEAVYCNCLHEKEPIHVNTQRRRIRHFTRNVAESAETKRKVSSFFCKHIILLNFGKCAKIEISLSHI